MSQLGKKTSLGQYDGESKIGMIVLAAGASTRMGQPKQLLLHRGRTLLRNAVEIGLASVCRPVVVVLGAHAELMNDELKTLPVLMVENPDWEKGMSSSIRIGVETLLTTSVELDGVVIMLCDQPLVTAGVVNELVETHYKTEKKIVVSAYGQVRGVPVFFSSRLFAEIAELRAYEGARQIVKNHPNDVATVYFPEAAVDIDTPQDYELLKTIGVETPRPRKADLTSE
jgi:molybdenum cofactor cytidylyltransferase